MYVGGIGVRGQIKQLHAVSKALHSRQRSAEALEVQCVLLGMQEWCLPL